MVHLHNGILHIRNIEQTPTFHNNVHRNREYYAKSNKPCGKRQIPYDLTNNRNLMNRTNEQNRTKITETRNRLRVTSGWGTREERRGMA